MQTLEMETKELRRGSEMFATKVRKWYGKQNERTRRWIYIYIHMYIYIYVNKYNTIKVKYCQIVKASIKEYDWYDL